MQYLAPEPISLVLFNISTANTEFWDVCIKSFWNLKDVVSIHEKCPLVFFLQWNYINISTTGILLASMILKSMIFPHFSIHCFFSLAFNSHLFHIIFSILTFFFCLFIYSLLWVLFILSLDHKPFVCFVCWFDHKSFITCSWVFIFQIFW